jgi:meckelin
MNELESNQYKLSEAQQITYNSVIKDNGDLSSQTVTQSDTFKYFFYKAAIGCSKDNDPTMCQVLSNLCVLQLYSEKETVCSFYRSLAFDNTTLAQANSKYPDKGWVEGLPWLYYQDKPSEILRKSNRVDITMSFFQPTTA